MSLNLYRSPVSLMILGILELATSKSMHRLMYSFIFHNDYLIAISLMPILQKLIILSIKILEVNLHLLFSYRRPLLLYHDLSTLLISDLNKAATTCTSGDLGVSSTEGR